MKFLQKHKPRAAIRPKLKRTGVLGILIILSLLLSPTIQSASASGASYAPSASPYTWTNEVVEGPPFFYMMTDRSLRYDRSLTPKPCAAYGGDHLYFSCWNSAANTWSTETVDSSTMVGSYAALAFNNQNVPFISYYDANNAVLKLAFRTAPNVWYKIVADDGTLPPGFTPVADPNNAVPEIRTPEQVQQAQTTFWDQLLQFFPGLPIFAPGFLYGKIGVGKHTSIDIGADNIVHVSYYDETYGMLRHVYWNLNFFPTPPVKEVVDYRHDGDLGLWTSIVVDELNRPQISYMDEKYDDLRYAIKNGNSWDTMVVDNGVNVGPFSSIAIDPTDPLPAMYPHIVYMSFNYNTQHYALKYAHLNSDNVTWDKGVINGSSGVGLFASLTIDKSGDYHASYYNGIDGNLLYSKSQNGTTWGNPVTVASTGDQGLFTSVAFNSNDDPAIAFVDATNGVYKMAYKVSNTWNSAASIGITGNVGLFTSLAINSVGRPHISYLNETSGLLKHAQWNGSLWGTDVVTNTASLGTFHSIDLAYDSIPKVAFYDLAHGDLYLSTRYNSWSEDLVDSYGDVGAFVSLSVDPKDTPHMSYVDQTLDRLIYASWDVTASDWITETKEYSGIGGFTSLATDGYGLFGNLLSAISYFDFANENLKLTYVGQAGTPQFLQVYNLGNPNDATPIIEPYSAVDYDNLGRVHIAFYDETHHNLKFAILTPPNLSQIYLVDGYSDSDPNSNPSVLDVGRFVSLAIDKATNNRHLCYYDAASRDLRYAFFDGTWADTHAWDIDLVDTPGDVGMYCSIDLKGDGKPGISYYDASNADLKFARPTTFILPPIMVFLPLTIKP